MPLYDYRCQACGQKAEFLQKISDPPRTECPACGQSALVKQVTAAGFQLKGSGWYVTDFKGGRSSPPAQAAEKKTDNISESGTAAGGSQGDTPPANVPPATGSS